MSKPLRFRIIPRVGEGCPTATRTSPYSLGEVNKSAKEPAVVLPEPVVSVPEGEREQVWQHFEDVANSRVRDT